MKLTQEERKAIFAGLKTGKVKARAAVALLVADGTAPFFAEEKVFHALGGGDTRQEGKDGKMYYTDSGKSVEEVDRLMDE